MYHIIRSVIESRRYALADMLAKLDVIWLQGQITEEEREELICMAREKADPALSLNLYGALADLTARVEALEDRPQGEFPPYAPGKIYRAGNCITFGGRHYRCTAPEGMPCSWSPADYPAYWTEA